MTSPQIIQWLKAHQAIKPSTVERSLKLPSGTIRQAMAGLREIPDKHIPVILKELEKYGLK